jgi:hypothetical protein
MDNTQKQQIAQDLYDFASKALTRLSTPRFSFTVNSANYFMIKEFEKFSQQTKLGNIITVALREDYVVKPILLEINFSFEDETNFELKFGNRMKLSDGSWSLADSFAQATTASTTVSFNKFDYSDYSKNAKDDVTNLLNSAWDTAKNAVISSQNQEVLINEHGIQCREIDTATGQFKPEQLWIINNMIAMSKDSFNTADVAIGKIQDSRYGALWGISAPLLVGKVLAGNNLRIENSANQFILDETGCTLTNAKFTLTSTNNKGKIILDPTTSSAITVQGNVGGTWINQFSINSTTGKAEFRGDLVAGGTITIGSGNSVFKADTNGIYLGNSTFSDAPFSVTTSGQLYAKDAHIEGDISGSTISGSIFNGGTINGTIINTTKDINVGNNIYLNATTYDGKMIQFNPQTFIKYVGLAQKLSIESESGISMLSRGDMLISSTGEIRFVSYNNNLILPYNSYLGTSYDSNQIVTQGDLSGFVSKSYVDNNFADISHTHGSYYIKSSGSKDVKLQFFEGASENFFEVYVNGTYMGSFALY